MNIKQASISDLESLVILFDKYRQFYSKPSDIKSGTDFLKQRIINKESIIYIAIDSNEQITGFVQLYPLFSSTNLKKAWLLNDLFVDQSQRGKGISKQLIDVAKELCVSTQAKYLMLETEKSNTIGNQLYPSVGFQLMSDVNFYQWTAP